MEARKLLRGCQNYSAELRKIKGVPLEDRNKVEQLASDSRALCDVYEPGTWVRMRHGLFKGDIGLVLHVRESDVLTIALLPRYWAPNDLSKGSRKREKRRRPPQRLLTDAELRTTTEDDVETAGDRGIIKYGKGKYMRSGLRVMEVYGLHATIATIPTASEVEVFTGLGYNTRYITNKTFLNVGDQVRITLNEDRSIAGFARIVEEDHAWIETDVDKHLPLLKVHVKDIERCLSVGTLVAVRIGGDTGRRGYVVSETEEFVVLVDERDATEVKCTVKSVMSLS